MDRPILSLRRMLLAATPAMLLVGAFPRGAVGLTPSSPEVKAMVAKGIEYLESEAAGDQRLGAQALMGLALLKNKAGPNHPKVRAAVEAIKNNIDDLTEPGREQLYSPGMTVMFLIAHDPVANAAEINAILRYLESVQKPHGGWGYASKPTGDTSMTQYCVLSVWEAKQYKFDVAFRVMEDVAVWLLKVQDPSGGFPYQGEPASGFELVRQKEIRRSTTAASLGCLYMCGDYLGLLKLAEEGDKLPSALRRVRRATGRGRRPSSTRVDGGLIREAIGRGNRWIQTNYSVEAGGAGYQYYYLYALERYWSFREAAEGREDPSPKWYNEGAEYLKAHQHENGSWNDRCGTTADTAFGVLFLLRSTREQIRRARDYGSSTLIGGRGLPSETDSVVIRGGKVVATPHLELVEQVLEAMKDADDPDYSEAMAALAELPSDEVNPMIAKYADKLQQLTAAASPEARLAAVQALSKTRNMDYVPVLIYALTDPDRYVVLEARDGLRRISRKFDGFGLPDQFTEAERRVAIQKWKDWYRAVRPDAEFKN